MSSGAVTAGMPLTDWIDGSVKPVRKGVYERDIFEGVCQNYSYWDGASWSGYAGSAIEAFQFRGSRSDYQTSPWRGLAADPSKAAS